MRIDEFLRDPRRREFASVPEADALLEDGALREAYLVGLRVDAVTGGASFLFDCRGALQIELGNTAVLAVSGLQSLGWTVERRATARTQWSVIGWSPTGDEWEWRVVAVTVPSGRLEVVAAQAEFFVGNIPGGDDPPPDFGTATDDEIRSGLADWTSEFEPVYATFVDTRRPD